MLGQDDSRCSSAALQWSRHGVRSRCPRHQLLVTGWRLGLLTVGKTARTNRAEASPERTERRLRGHRTIENGVFRVLDVRYDEDRLRARKTGTALSEVHQPAINLIRDHGYPYVPNGWRGISARTDYSLAFAAGSALLEK
jgi:hypothetical protein